MGQITREFAENIIKRSTEGKFSPLTQNEQKQLALAWLKLHGHIEWPGTPRPGGFTIGPNHDDKWRCTHCGAPAEMPNAIWLAKFFHDTYERLAPQFGYATRKDTRQFDHESPNGRLMAAVCEELRQALREPQSEKP